MLKQLLITNVILIESAQIHFSEGFNVLSGETGSGKSAIMSALNLIIGERSDVGMIRKGSEKGIVEAVFDIEESSCLIKILEESGIDHQAGEELLIRREISASGKNRCFINHQLANAALLKKVGNHLVEMVGQHANQSLLSIEKHTEILDLFGSLQQEVSAFGKSWNQELNVEKELRAIIENESSRIRQIEVCRMELEELKDASLKEDEDEALFAEYSFLVSVEERARKIQEILQTLSGEKQAVIPHLNRHRNTFEQLAKLDPSLEETAHSYEATLLELQEISHTLRNTLAQIEYQPDRISEINLRLELITRLKRKYGSTLAEINAYKQNNEKKLNELESADLQIEELQEKLNLLRNKNNLLAQELTEKRKQWALLLEKETINQLRSLNMPKVEFTVDISTQKRNLKGDDRIEFFLIPNVGEHRIPIKDCASGGELSRLMLALLTLLAGKEQKSILVFDEIDSNIGGETAAIVGKKLKEIGLKHQILCITHFPQVAQEAQHHLQISKKEIDGRTLTHVKTLDEETRHQELSRMLGGSEIYTT